MIGITRAVVVVVHEEIRQRQTVNNGALVRARGAHSRHTMIAGALGVARGKMRCGARKIAAKENSKTARERGGAITDRTNAKEGGRGGDGDHGSLASTAKGRATANSSVFREVKGELHRATREG